MSFAIFEAADVHALDEARRTADISAIADACGWSPPGDLRRIFRQRTGLSMFA